MDILYYLSSFPKLSKSFVLNELYELESQGHNVFVCSLRNPNEDITHNEYEQLDIPIQYVGEVTHWDFPELFSRVTLHPRLLKNTLYWYSPDHHVGNLIRAKRCIDVIEYFDWNVDHVHTHFAGANRYAARQIAAYYDVPFTITTHAFDLYREPVGNYTAPLLRGADRIVTISEYNKRHIKKTFTDDTPIDVVRAGIRPEKFEPTSQTVEKRILSVARFVEKKGLRYALDAVAMLVEDYPDIEYHLVGSGELEGNLKRRVEKLGIQENVSFLDNVSDSRLRAEFDEARTFVLPCIIDESGNRDGIPVSLMEAMAMKTPAVSTRVSGIPELISHEKDGMLAEPHDSEAIAAGLRRMLEDDTSWNQFADSARDKVVRDFNIKTETKKLEQTFKKARDSY